MNKKHKLFTSKSYIYDQRAYYLNVIIKRRTVWTCAHKSCRKKVSNRLKVL